MTEDADSYTQAEIVRTLKRIDENVSTLSADFRRLEQNYVTRAEWSLWKEGNDRELKQVKESIRPVKVSGWTIAAFGLSAVGIMASLVVAGIALINAIK